jgi:hypothetical protein
MPHCAVCCHLPRNGPAEIFLQAARDPRLIDASEEVLDVESGAPEEDIYLPTCEQLLSTEAV